MINRLCLSIALLMTPFAATAHEYRVGDIVVDHPMAQETAKTAVAGAGYLIIINTGDTADRLVAVEADFPRVMIHESVVDDGIATMKHLADIELAPGETVTLEPGGKHVMFMGLNGDPFEVGEKVPATLVFETAGRLDVVFNVEAIADTVDHSNHGN